MSASPVVSAPDDFGAFVAGVRLRVPPTGTGALDGLTFAVKDLIDVAGVPTGGGNPDWLRTHPAPATQSAPCVTNLLAAGAAIDGKTITDELAFSLEGVNAHYGTPRNPACPGRIPGGSSSGSGVAVAAALVDFALGTDTGGSVRVPASFTGVYGCRPSHGRISLEGVLPFAPSFDTVGWFARDASTLAKVGRVLLGDAPAGAPIDRLVILDDAFALADAAVATSLMRAAEAWGAREYATLFDGHPGEWLECYRILQLRENWEALGDWIRAETPTFGAAIAPRFADAATITAADADRQKAVRETLTARLHARLPAGTAFVLPTAATPALSLDAKGETIGDFYERALTLTAIAGLTRACQVTVPAGTVEGCPVGLSFLAAPGQDAALLACVERLAASGCLA